jgi:hypothetical protein
MIILYLCIVVTHFKFKLVKHAYIHLYVESEYHPLNLIY